MRPILLVMLGAFSLLPGLPTSASAASLGPPVSGLVAIAPSEIVPVARVVRRTTTVARPGGTAVRRSTTVVTHPGAWRRPANYWWRPGAAVAAGAAVGFVTAAAAASYAGKPPASGYCWYYTSPSKTSGFWDVCP